MAMERVALSAQPREVLGKKVKRYRKEGLVPAHVFGKGLETEHLFVNTMVFKKVFDQAGETGLINLKIGDGDVKPVLIRDLQYDPVTDSLLHIDFYQVNLKEKVNVFVPIELKGVGPESVHLGETVVLNPVSEVEIEALPNDLIDKIEVDISVLKEVDDAVIVAELLIDREKITVLTPEEEVVVKLAPAVTEEMAALLEEQEAEVAEAAAEAAEEGAEEGEKVEGEEEATEGEVAEGEEKPESIEEKKEGE